MAASRRERELLDFIKSYSREIGYPPTYDEMARHLGRSSSTVHGHIKQLITKGYLRRNGLGARALEVVPEEYRPYPENVAIPTPENGFEIPPEAKYVPVSVLPGLFAHWLRRRHRPTDAGAAEP